MSEIAALSSSQHKSQGWGRPGQRGYDAEFLEYSKGPRADKDLFEGVNTSWSRLKGGDKVQSLVSKAIQNFDEENPSASVPVLFQIRKEILKVEEGVWRNRKVREVEELIQNCLGLFVEVKASSFWISPGENLSMTAEVVNRSPIEVSLTQISAPDLSYDTMLAFLMKNDISTIFKTDKTLIADKPYSDPYWLQQPHEQGIFIVENESLIGKPENDPAVFVEFKIRVGVDELIIKRPLIYKWTDPVKGELWRPLEVVPPISVDLSENVLVFSDDQPRDVNVRIRSSRENSIKGNLKLQLPEKWHSDPASIAFELNDRDEERTVRFKVYPGNTEITSSLSAVVEVEGNTYDKAIRTISYDHIPIQTYLPKAEAKVARVNLRKEGNLIGFIPGAGDDIPTALRTMGYEVWEMKPNEVTQDNLKRVDAVVLGIRALNVHERIRYIMPTLIEYVKTGGTMVVQYNTNGRLETESFAPFPISLSRDRVSDEGAQVRILKPEHTLLNYPNKITDKDFEGWVQERGLYFPSKWDSDYEALLSMNDPGEDQKDGGLLIAKYGEGHFIYTGLSFFRQLPEGVPGAYKLFANLVSIGKIKKTKS